VTLDLEQLRDATLDDDELMREILAALIDDTSRQIPLLEAAIQAQDPARTKRLAHYSKGACANVGARAAAAALEDLERQAARSDFVECSASLGRLSIELDLLRAETIPAA
jgi:HPt (histidine-containing phosphotransfer) domain-containing protein